jgi:hypothetical protein
MRKRIIKLNERQLNKIVKRVLSESYEGGIIQRGDVPCHIWCQQKLAKVGSNGDVVKMIQHLLFNGGYNKKYSGGGMTGDACEGKWQHCDGKFRKHTKDAVLEFQRDHADLTNDGVVGYQTLSKMCEVLSPNRYTSNFTLCEKQCRCNDIDIDNDQDDFDDIDVYNPINRVECDTLKSCVYKYLYKTAPDIKGFMRCTGLTDSDLPIPPKKGCISDDGRSLCDIVPKPIPPGMAGTAVMGYYYDPVKGKCVTRTMGGGPFSQMEKCRECCERK